MTGLTPQLREDRLGHELRICLALREFHHLAGQEIRGLVVAVADFLGGARIRFDGLVDEGVDLAGVGGLETQVLRDGGRLLFGRRHLRGEDVLGLVVGNRARLDQVDQGPDFVGGHRALADGQALFVEHGEQVVDDPVGDFFADGEPFAARS